jgi:S-adenosylmethionine hydrolase
MWVITLTTDFGLRDAYVACMKGVILGIAPESRIVDVSHSVSPQDIREAGFLLAAAWPYFPAGTLHVAVVDPGVGTSRRPIAVVTEHGTFIGPDNGIFCPALQAMGRIEPQTGALKGAHGVELTSEDHRLKPTSRTFHGRDIFAPAAGHLATGVPLEHLGGAIDRVTTLDLPGFRRRGRTLEGAVAHIDGFGNVITSIPGRELPPEPVIRIGDATIQGLAESYQDRPLGALVSSGGFLEIAVRNGDAARRLGVRRGDPVEVLEAP